MFGRITRLLGRSLTALAGAALLWPVTVTRAETYNVTDLGAYIQPKSISDNGLITGINTSTGTAAIFHDGSTATTLLSSARGLAINDNGIIAGHQILSSTQTRALLWHRLQPLTALSNLLNIVSANGINSFDEVVGYRLTQNNNRRPFVYDISTGNMRNLGTLGGAEGWANAINNRGTVTGSAYTSTGQAHAFIFDSSGKLTSLNTLEGYTGSEGLDISDGDRVVGFAYTQNPNQRGKRAFIASTENSMLNLGSLLHDPDSIARAINSTNTVVGQSIDIGNRSRAFLYNVASADIMTATTDPLAPQTIYMGSTSGGGLFKSTNRGETWTTITRGLGDLNISAIAVDPVNNNIVYAGTRSGVYKSTNGGSSWISANIGIEAVTVYALLINRTNPSHILAGTNRGLYVSNDGASTWQLKLMSSSSNQATPTIFTLLQHPTNANAFLAGTSRSVYGSTDGGTTWAQITNGLVNANVYALVIDPVDPNVLYAGTLGSGVFRNNNWVQNQEWTNTSTGLVNRNVYAMTLHTSGGITTIYAGTREGMYRSTDAGQTWSRNTAFGNDGVYSLSLSQEGGITYLYATTFNGNVYRTSNNGEPLATTWTVITRGVGTADVYDVLILADDPADPTDFRKVYIGTSNGSFRNTDETTRWTTANSGVVNGSVFTLEPDTSTTPATLWAGTGDRGIYRSIDGGSVWIPLNNGLGSRNVYDIAMDHSTAPATLYAATLGGVYRSSNDGASWSAANNGLGTTSVFSLLIDSSSSPPLLYAGTGDGVYRSADAGQTWVAVNAGLQGKDIVALGLDTGTNPDTLYAVSTTSGVFKSTNQAATWSNVLPDTGVYALELDRTTNPNALLIGTSTGVLKSTDAGATWTPRNTGISSNRILNIAIDPNNSNVLFAAAEGGIFASTDGGTSWTAMTSGLASVVNRLQTLDTMITASNWVLREATDINNLGQIVGWGELNGVPHGFLLSSADIGISHADITVTQTSKFGMLKKGTPLNMDIVVHNNGPDAATNVELLDWLPAGAIYRNAAASQGPCNKDPQQHLVRCHIGNINPGQSVRVAISVEPTERNITLTNIVRARSNEADPDFDNNTSRLERQVDRCFIATAAYGSFLDPHVTALRQFRDDYLLTNPAGREFVRLYYRLSPPMAAVIAEHDGLRFAARLVLTPVILTVEHPVMAAALVLMLLITARRFHLRLRH